MTNEYEKQAEQFLKETNTVFKAEWIKHDFYFQDDKDKRDIYEITLKRGDRVFKFNFGQSLDKSGLTLFNLNEKRINHKNFEIPEEIIKLFNVKPKDKKRENSILTNEQYAKIKLKLWFEDKHFSLSGLKFKIGEKPTAYDVLSCLQKQDVGTFENFCSEFGYDEDSRKAEKIYNAVCKEWDNVKMLWSDAEIEKLQEIN